MALVTCPECGQTVSTSADYCPHCGCPHMIFMNPEWEYGEKQRRDCRMLFPFPIATLYNEKQQKARLWVDQWLKIQDIGHVKAMGIVDNYLLFSDGEREGKTSLRNALYRGQFDEDDTELKKSLGLYINRGNEYGLASYVPFARLYRNNYVLYIYCSLDKTQALFCQSLLTKMKKQVSETNESVVAFTVEYDTLIYISEKKLDKDTTYSIITIKSKTRSILFEFSNEQENLGKFEPRQIFSRAGYIFITNANRLGTYGLIEIDYSLGTVEKLLKCLYPQEACLLGSKLFFVNYIFDDENGLYCFDIASRVASCLKKGHCINISITNAGLFYSTLNEGTFHAISNKNGDNIIREAIYSDAPSSHTYGESLIFIREERGHAYGPDDADPYVESTIIATDMRTGKETVVGSYQMYVRKAFIEDNYIFAYCEDNYCNQSIVYASLSGSTGIIELLTESEENSNESDEEINNKPGEIYEEKQKLISGQSFQGSTPVECFEAPSEETEEDMDYGKDADDMGPDEEPFSYFYGGMDFDYD